MLYVSDGTVAGTTLVKDIFVGNQSSGPANFAVSVSGSTLFFQATDASGAELWKSDGTTAGTVMVADIVSGATGSTPVSLVPLAGGVVFLATTSAEGQEPWFSDGTSLGTASMTFPISSISITRFT